MTTINVQGQLKKEVQRRQELEEFAKKRFTAIFENRVQRIVGNLAQYDSFGLIRHLQSARFPLGWENEWQNMIVQYMREWVAVGYKKIRSEGLTNLPNAENNPLAPNTNNIMNYWDTYGLKLAKMEDKDLIQKTIDDLKEGIKGNLTRKELESVLRKRFTTFSRSRIGNIIQTESGKAYNWGGLSWMYANNDVCKYLEILAVMDKRTTDICISRNGIIIPMDDFQLVAAMTPPFHYRCRTRQSPVVSPSRTRLLHGHDKELRRQALAVKDTHPALKGFGLSPDDLNIFKPVANKTWLLQPSSIVNWDTAVKRSVRSFASKYINSRTEHMQIVELTGDVRTTVTSNMTGSVDLVADVSGRIAIHNHPGGTIFSSADILVSVNNSVHEMYVVGEYITPKGDAVKYILKATGFNGQKLTRLDKYTTDAMYRTYKRLRISKAEFLKHAGYYTNEYCYKKIRDYLKKRGITLTKEIL